MPAKKQILTSKQVLGQAAEAKAAEFLQAQGLVVLERNFSCKTGEIDLILQDGKELVFAEVRFRKNSNFGGAAASVTPAKQQRLQLTASFYLGSWRQPPACRFDVLAMTYNNQQQIVCDNWIKNAF